MKKQVIAAQLSAAMASIEAAYALLEVEEPTPDPGLCPHDNKTYLAMKRWICDDCNQQGND